MDIRTGQTYSTLEAALEDGVPRSDIAQILGQRLANGQLVVKFSKGSFKSVRRNERGELVRVL